MMILFRNCLETDFFKYIYLKTYYTNYYGLSTTAILPFLENPYRIAFHKATNDNNFYVFAYLCIHYNR